MALQGIRLALTVTELIVIFFVPSQYVRLLRLLSFDDALNILGTAEFKAEI